MSRQRRRRARGMQGTVLDMVNEQRRDNGRRPLRASKGLRIAAHARARDMAKRDYFSHVAPDGEPWYRRIERAIGARGWGTLGENIAQGQQSASEVVIDWMRSPAHKENILAAKYTHMGLSLVRDGDREVWCQVFGGK